MTLTKIIVTAIGVFAIVAINWWFFWKQPAPSHRARGER